MQLQPLMRKRINILFVAMAISSVTYGMILRYSDKSQETAQPIVTELIPQQVSSSENDYITYPDDVVDLDALMVEPD